MLAIIIILLVVVVIELIVCFVIHADRKKTHDVYLFMAEMVSNQGGALQQALEDLKVSSKYADPAESAAAITEIVRFLESFNSTVRKQAERIEEARKHKWHQPVTGLLKKKKKAAYTPPVKKKAAEKKEAEKEEAEEPEGTQEESEFAKIEEKIEKKLAQEEDKPKKVKRFKRRFKKVRPGAPKKPEGETTESPDKGSGPKTPGAGEKKAPGDSDTDFDLAPPPESE